MSPRSGPVSPQRLLRECLVQVNGDPELGGGGSGVFVAPGYVLTCSHVVPGPDGQSGQGRAVSGLRDGGEWSGDVVFASPPPTGDRGPQWDVWPFPDVAVIRLSEDFAHRCARLARFRPADDSPDGLDEDDPDVPAWNGEMYAVGRHSPVAAGPSDYPTAMLHYAGPHVRMLRLTGDRFHPGMSGGPVLDLRTGKVCALLKVAADDDGGFAVPLGDLPGILPPRLATDVLAGHDAFHGRESQHWPATQDQLWTRLPEASPDPSSYTPGRPLLRPTEEAEILGILAGLSPGSVSAAPDLRQLYAEATAAFPLPVEPGKLRSIQDLVFSLCERTHLPGSLHPVIAFAEILARDLLAVDPDSAATLRDWSTAVAARRGERELHREWRALRPRPGGPPAERNDAGRTLIIKLEPINPGAANPNYMLTVMRYIGDSDGRPILVDPVPHTLAETKQALRSFFKEAIQKLGCTPTLIELVVPVYLFDEPAHLWQLFEDPYPPPGSGQAIREFARLGYMCPVVVRPLERFGSVAYRDTVGPWWNQLSRQPGVPLIWVGCDGQDTVDGMLRQLAPRQRCLGMACPAGSGDGFQFMSHAVWANVPIAVWRRLPCRQHSAHGGAPANSGQPCEGSAFRNIVDPVVTSTRLTDLPMAAMRMRNGNQTGTPDVLLMWDNPMKSPPHSRLQLS